MNLLERNLLLPALIAAAVFSAFTAKAEVYPQAFGEVWQSQGSPSNQQAQVVYYRTAAVSGKDAALVYVDSEFQAALLPGMYTRFCVAAGEHTLGAYQKDAPYYRGKSEPGFRAKLKGGKTYFVQVDGAVNGRPLAVKRVDAEQQLSALRMQKHALSRASAVQACQYDQKPTTDYSLGSDLLFNFGKSGLQDMQPQGRQAVTALMNRLKKDGVQNNRIEVIGHTDSIGSESRNQQLGGSRANTVKQLLINYGIPAGNISVSSMASRQPVVQCANQNLQARKACNAPNRRVVVRVETNQ